jgi:ketosteroid isomerase-like protein
MDNVELVRGAYAAFAAGDVPAVLQLLDPNVEWY